MITIFTILLFAVSAYLLYRTRQALREEKQLLDKIRDELGSDKLVLDENDRFDS
jgi:hypothetical protein